MPHVRPKYVVDSALAASKAGMRDADNAALHGVAVKTIRRWRRLYQRRGHARGQQRARVKNWATRVVAGEKRRYDYPRWQFSNRSEDILGLCGWALDLVEVPWRRSAPWTISVSRREAVARLDDLIGLKS